MWIPELSLWPDMEDGEKQEGNWVWRGGEGRAGELHLSL